MPKHKHWRQADVYLLMILSLACPPSTAIDIRVSGTWNHYANAADLRAGAGSDLQGAYASHNDQIVVDILNTAGAGDAWRVYVRLDDSDCDSRMGIWVRRASAGIGAPLSGGAGFTPVSTAGTAFFSGHGDSRNIYVQLRIDGVSINVPPSDCLSTLRYEVVDLP